MSNHLQHEKTELNIKTAKKRYFAADKAVRDTKITAPKSERFASANSVFILGVSVLLLILIKLLPIEGTLKEMAYILPCAAAAFDTGKKAVQKAMHGKFLTDEIFQVAALLFAFISGSGAVAAVISIFLLILNIAVAFLQDRLYLAEKNQKAKAVVRASVERDGVPERCSPEEVNVGEIVYVAPGEQVPLDGVIIEGTSALDPLPHTGNSLPFAVSVNSEAVAGCINCSNPIRIRVTRPYSDSISAQISNCRESYKEPLTVFFGRINKLAKIIHVFCLVLALIYAVVMTLFNSSDWNSMLLRASSLLLIGCFGGVSLAASIPVRFGLYNAMGKGAVFKSALSLEALSKTESMVFNKTGTVTSSKYSIVDVAAENISEDELLAMAALAESCSDHPIGAALCALFGGISPEHNIMKIQEYPGRGICAFVDGKQVFVGNAGLFVEHGIVYSSPRRAGLAIHVAIDGEYCGYIIVNDRARDYAFDSLEALRMSGIKNLSMLTCDVRNVARTVASSLNFDMVKAELTNEGKLSALEYLIATKSPGTMLAFVGDRDNETAAIERADVGIVLDALHSENAFAVADIAIIDDDLRKLAHAYSTAKISMNTSTRGSLAILLGKIFLFALVVIGIIPLIAVAVADAVLHLIIMAYDLRATGLQGGNKHE